MMLTRTVTQDAKGRTVGVYKVNVLQQRIGELIEQHGSLRAAGRALNIDHAYLWRLYEGTKREPTPAVLKKLGLRRVVSYVRSSSTRSKT